MDLEIKVIGNLPERNGHGRRGFDWTAICDAVADAKGKWCEIGVFHPSIATQIRQGRYPSVDPERFEVTTRTTGDRLRSTLYMRLR
jgi:hypothetical protein